MVSTSKVFRAAGTNPFDGMRLDGKYGLGPSANKQPVRVV